MKIVLAVVLLLIANAGAQDCSTTELTNSIESLVGSSLVGDSQFASPTVTVLDQNIVCLVTDTMRGEYSVASVVVNYTCDGLACQEQSESFLK